MSMTRSFATVALVTAALLLVPLVAMQFTTEVNWSVGDFIAAGALLLSAGAVYVLASARARSAVQKALIAAIVLLVLLLVWAELAVGIF